MKKVLAIAIMCVTLLTACNGTGLHIVDVSAPAINFIYDADGIIVVNDTSDDIILIGMEGVGFLQSRTLPVGEPGTAAEGLYGYQYRIDLREVAGIIHIDCISSFSIEFGPVSSLDYDGDGDLDDVFVITGGGLGSVAPTSVTVSGDTLTFHFPPGVCAGHAPGYGDSSFFFGLTSTFPPCFVQSEIMAGGTSYSLEARVPDFGP